MKFRTLALTGIASLVGLAVSTTAQAQETRLAAFSPRRLLDPSADPPMALFSRAAEVKTTAENAEPTAAQIAVGWKLFHEPLLSTTGEIACATCHRADHGFSDPRATSLGVTQRNGRRGDGKRHSQSIEDAAFNNDIFWDGRARFMEGQATQPLQAAAEMGQQNLGQAFSRIARIPAWQQEFITAFGHDVNVTDGILAIAAWERTIVSSEAPIDRYLAGQTWVLSDAQQRGHAVFMESGCANCHFGKSYSDGGFHNILGATRDRNRQLDTGLGQINGRQADNFKFKTPSLRDVAKRAPYCHAGQFMSLGAMIVYLDNPTANVEIGRQNWTRQQMQDLLAFLEGDGDDHPGAFESYNFKDVDAPTLPR